MRRNFLMAVCAVLLGGSLASAGGRGKFVDVSKLPPAVLNSADKAANDTEWLMAFRHVEFFRGADTTWYRLSGAPRTQKRLVMAMVLESGEVIEVRTSMALEEVPPVVTSAMKRRFPAFKAASAHAAGKTSKATIYYLLVGEMNGTKCAYSVSTDGSTIRKND